jgi:nucleotide-binding universal stress UspA family protein
MPGLPTIRILREKGMYKKVLVPLDGSTFSELALANAVNIISSFQGAELVLLNVTEPFEDLAHWVSDDIAKKMQKEADSTARNYLDRTVERLSNEGVEVEAVIAEGNPGEVILEYAAKSGVDLIVMSTHGRSGFTRFMFGSVATRIVQNSHVPVLLVPPANLASQK